ncbi:hypothetical protein [Actinomyces culturomici]|uniref:hypothetical protein n=1 Tax=Actinomyces culturomici TaxID=1926276 RepID=UPI000E208EEA|nr:hypothetical protein [Actinomyces culturomici]
MPRTPDVKKLIIDYLKERLDGIPVVSKRPDTDPPEEFVRVIAAGGPGRTSRILTRASLIVDSYSVSTGKAAALAGRVDEAIHALPSSAVPVNVVESGEPGEFPDPDRTDRPRYSATYTFTIRLI